jgi:hypothetical protein
MARNRRRSAGRAPEERRTVRAAEDGPDEHRLAARPDGQEDTENEERDGEGQGQEDGGQDKERNGPAEDHGLSPFPFILGRSRPAVNKKGSNL